MNKEKQGIGIRALSIILDTIVLGILFYIIGAIYAGGLTYNIQFYGTEAIAAGGLVSLVGFLYFVLLEGLKGQTLGKMATGIKVVKENGEPCDLISSLIRNILRIIDGIFAYIVGAIIIANSENNQRLGDIAGNTIVVKK